MTDGLEMPDDVWAIVVIGCGSAINQAAVAADHWRLTVEGMRDGRAKSLTPQTSIRAASNSRHVIPLPGGSRRLSGNGRLKGTGKRYRRRKLLSLIEP